LHNKLGGKVGLQHPVVREWLHSRD